VLPENLAGYYVGPANQYMDVIRAQMTFQHQTLPLPGHFGRRITALRNLLDGFDFKFLGIALAVHEVLLMSVIYTSGVSKKPVRFRSP
jgi:hypothetical protein